MNDFSPLGLIALSLLGGWVAADGTSFGQFMVSRPIVAATLAGLVVGDPVAGGAIGVLLEAFHLTVLPVGASRYPEGGPAAVAAGAVFAVGPQGAAALLILTAFALLWEWLSGHTVHQLRQFNVRFSVLHRDGASLERELLTAVAVDWLRGITLAFVGIVVAAEVAAQAIPLWGLNERLSSILVSALLVAMIGSTLKLLGGKTAWFACGLAVAVLFLLISR